MYIKEYCQGMKALEIGGPSAGFNELGIYETIRVSDGVNFNNNTLWQTSQEGKGQYNYHSDKTGDLYICEGTNLFPISDNSYDLILSSNNLEHIANPLKALEEWIRVGKNNGYILLLLPKKEDIFDHQRPDTTINHLIDDYNNNIDEADLTHLEEILKLHDLVRDPWAGSFLNFCERSLKNFDNRCLHHHVFNKLLILEMFQFLHLTPIH